MWLGEKKAFHSPYLSLACFDRPSRQREIGPDAPVLARTSNGNRFSASHPVGVRKTVLMAATVVAISPFAGKSSGHFGMNRYSSRSQRSAASAVELAASCTMANMPTVYCERRANHARQTRTSRRAVLAFATVHRRGLSQWLEAGRPFPATPIDPAAAAGQLCSSGRRKLLPKRCAGAPAGARSTVRPNPIGPANGQRRRRDSSGQRVGRLQRRLGSGPRCIDDAVRS